MIPAAILAMLALAFLAGFLVPGLLHWWRLRRLQQRIHQLGPNAEVAEVGRLFDGDTRMAHLWRQYRETLHMPQGAAASGAMETAARATLPADTFINPLSVVDGRLRSEFFKHLPGIFTGIGIIGTFAGLIDGLRHFQVSDNTATVRASLEGLMHAVGEAFLVSASAIALAMLVTFIEKLLLSSLYARSEDIAQAIDARFEGAAGEDYLARLVVASEGAAGREESLRRVLVEELGATWSRTSTALGDRIESALRAQGDLIADSVAQALARSMEQALREPLQQLAQGAAAARDGAGHADSALRGTLEDFAARLSTTLERQVGMAGDAGRQGAREMHEAVQSLQSLVNAMAEQTRRTQMESGQQLNEGLQEIGRHTAEMLGAAQAVQERMLAQATEAFGALSGGAAQAAKGTSAQMEAAAAQIARAVDQLTNGSTEALQRLDGGAGAMNEASARLAQAAAGAAETMMGARRAADAFAEVGQMLGTGATALRDTLDDYRAQREAVTAMMSEFREMLQQARRDLGMGGETLARIEAATRGLQEAERECEQYLAGVSHVLGDAHQAFAQNVRKTLEMATGSFHERLASSVGLLASTIGELESVLGQAAPNAAPAPTSPASRPPSAGAVP